MNYLRVWGCRAVVRLRDPKLKTLCERGTECIFVGYVKHSKDFRFYVIEPNDSVAINSIIESSDDIFDENRFSSIPRPSQRSLVKGTKDSGGSVVPEKVIEEDDPKTFDEAMKSQDVAFWKEAINDEMDSISGIDYFDTYAPVARISTIRLLIAMTSIHNLIIHQMDVKTTFLNVDLDEEIYMNQPQGFIMPGNKNKVDLTKEFLLSKFSMKDMGEANVIFDIRIKHESNGIAISQSLYIEKVLKKFNYFDCTPVSTPMDTSEKLMPNNGQAVSQLEYSRVIGCLMYAMTCTRPDIAFAVGKLSRYTSNPGTQHWEAIQRVLKYLKKTMDYRLTYIMVILQCWKVTLMQAGSATLMCFKSFKFIKQELPVNRWKCTVLCSWMSDDTGEEDIKSLLSSFNDTIEDIKGSDGLTFKAGRHVSSDPAQGKTNGKTTDDELMIDSTTRPVSYVSALNTKTRTKKVNFRELQPQESVEDVDLKIPKASVEEVSGRVGNTLYGYFIRKRLAFPIVENYVWNAWSKFGILKVMMNTKGFFFFKFSTKKELEDELEAGPWMIRNTLIILNAWTPRTTLMKEDLTKVPVWVKLHDVPIVAYTADGLSLIATKIGTLKMLDSYTCTMYEESWGRNSYARAMIELNSEKELVNNLVVAIPLLEEEGYTKETIRVEYEWLPPRCTACKTFGHMTDQCPKNTAEKTIVNVADDGFRQVGNRHGKNIAANAKKVDEANATQKVNKNEASTSKAESEDECEHVYDETGTFMKPNKESGNSEGAGTPVKEALMGDFNASLNLEDCHSGSSKISISMRKFKECVSEIEVQDVNCSGLHYTWNQKPKGEEGILKKIDCVICNLKFMDEFMGTYAIFQPYRISDHSLAVLKIPKMSKSKPKPFKFTNFLVYKLRFSEVVKREWEKRVDGNKMFQIVSKLKSLKSPFRKFLKDQGNLHLRVECLRTELYEAQKDLDCDLSNSILCEEEAIYLKAFNQAVLDEERFLKQKVKIEWLAVGDSNSSYFHKSVKSRVQRNRIEVVRIWTILSTKHLPSDVGDQMVCLITNDEIKKVMSFISDNRTPGPDGYSSAFFKKGWDIIGNDVCDAVREFFY
ncbi:zinc finger, CCHC-type containing protein [Tanacetum coccineum]